MIVHNYDTYREKTLGYGEMYLYLFFLPV